MLRHVVTLCFLAACAPKDAPEPAVINDTPAPNSGELTLAPSLNIDLATFTQNTNGLRWKDLAVGDGAEVKAGQQVSAHYAGYLTNGTNFESSRPGAPISFPVGVGRVIDGWDQGLLGMRVGGTRQLIIPPALGYGPAGSPPVIPPNATLVFTVEVVGAQ